MLADAPLWLILDLVGTFAFALNGALTAVRAARLDIFGVITLGMFTGLGGGTIRDVLLDALPPATFVDWRYLAVASTAGLEWSHRQQVVVREKCAPFRLPPRKRDRGPPAVIDPVDHRGCHLSPSNSPPRCADRRALPSAP